MNVALITARGNNQSIKDKNLVKVAGKEILRYPIEASLKATEIDEVYLSTDCEKIKKLGREYGINIIDRPEELCQPDANHGDVIIHARDRIEADIVTVLLGNTVMVTPELIDESIVKLQENPDADSVISVWKAQDDHPYRALKLEDGYLKSFLDITRNTNRQSYNDIYFYDQGVWTTRFASLGKAGPSPWWWLGKTIPIVREWVTGRDIHSELDIYFSEKWVELQNGIAREQFVKKEDIQLDKDKYNELIMAVGKKWKGETRHQTALRYIKQAEKNSDTAICNKAKDVVK